VSVLPATVAEGGGGPRRFIAPARDEVPAACFAHPLYDGVRGYADLLQGPRWPDVAALDARLAVPGQRFVRQDAALLADGLHYEARIAQGRIATRAENWHDLFNALIWACHPAIKQALNQQQCRHIAAMPAGQRNRAQAALTQFDESGVVVRVRDAALLAAWDAHDWPALFTPAHWQHNAIAIAAVFGHALLEQGLLPGRRLLGKCVVVVGDDDAGCLQRVAAAIAASEVLTDPLQLRPLPLLGTPGWQDAGQGAVALSDATYFRPLRQGRCYPLPLAARGGAR